LKEKKREKTYTILPSAGISKGVRRPCQGWHRLCPVPE